MKAIFRALLLVVSCGTLAAAQDNPYPTGCNDFITETVTCSDVDPGQGSCHGTLYDVIDYSTGGWGTYVGEFQTLACTGGTNHCQGNNSPTCPTCPSVPDYVVEETNPDCTEEGGGGSSCIIDGDCSGDQACCVDGMCSSCREQGEFGRRAQAAPSKLNYYSIEKAVWKADHSLN